VSRRIVSAWKTGGYGTTMWHHELSCGHVHSRRRRMPADAVVDCVECLEEAEGREMLERLPAGDEPESAGHAPETAPAPEPDELAGMLEWVAMAAAVLAARMGVPGDQVSIHVGEDGSIAGGTVILTPSDIERMLRELTT